MSSTSSTNFNSPSLKQSTSTSMSSTTGRIMKCAGRFTPTIGTPTLFASSMYTSDNVIGIPVRRASTSSRQEFRGS